MKPLPLILSVVLFLTMWTTLTSAPIVDPLEGTWKLSKLEVDGREAELGDRPLVWVIQGDKVLYGGEELAVLAKDGSTNPKTLDLKFASPRRTYEGIYSVDKETLTICVNSKTEGVKERPHLFSTEGKPEWRLLVFKKGKTTDTGSIDQLPGFVGMMISFDKDTNEVLIQGVLKNSPAEKAGLKKDDVLLKVAGGAATDIQTVVKTTRKFVPGTEIEMRLKRDGKAIDVKLKVGMLPFVLLD